MPSRDDLPYDGRIHGNKLVDGHDIEFVIDLLVIDNTVNELRDMARELGVKRQRGDNKRQTAAQIAHQADHKLKVVEGADGLMRITY